MISDTDGYSKTAGILIATLVSVMFIVSLVAPIASAKDYGSASIEQEIVEDNARVQIDITVTNNTNDNIENVLISPPSGTFYQAIGGNDKAWLENAVDNLDLIEPYLTDAGQDLINADTDLEDVGNALQDMSKDLDVAASYLSDTTSNWSGASSDIKIASSWLDYAADELTSDTVNMGDVQTYIDAAATQITDAAQEDITDSTLMHRSLLTAGSYLSDVATNVGDGNMEAAGDNLAVSQFFLNYAGMNEPKFLTENNAIADLHEPVITGTAPSVGATLTNFTNNTMMFLDKNNNGAYDNSEDIIKVSAIRGTVKENALYNFADKNVYVDNNHNSSFDNGEAIIGSDGNNILENSKAVGDNVITAGAADLINASMENLAYDNEDANPVDNFTVGEMIYYDNDGDDTVSVGDVRIGTIEVISGNDGENNVEHGLDNLDNVALNDPEVVTNYPLEDLVPNNVGIGIDDQDQKASYSENDTVILDVDNSSTYTSEDIVIVDNGVSLTTGTDFDSELSFTWHEGENNAKQVMVADYGDNGVDPLDVYIQNGTGYIGQPDAIGTQIGGEVIMALDADNNNSLTLENDALFVDADDSDTVSHDTNDNPDFRLDNWNITYKAGTVGANGLDRTASLENFSTHDNIYTADAANDDDAYTAGDGTSSGRELILQSTDDTLNKLSTDNIVKNGLIDLNSFAENKEMFLDTKTTNGFYDNSDNIISVDKEVHIVEGFTSGENIVNFASDVEHAGTGSYQDGNAIVKDLDAADPSENLFGTLARLETSTTGDNAFVSIPYENNLGGIPTSTGVPYDVVDNSSFYYKVYSSSSKASPTVTLTLDVDGDGEIDYELTSNNADNNAASDFNVTDVGPAPDADNQIGATGDNGFYLYNVDTGKYYDPVNSDWDEVKDNAPQPLGFYTSGDNIINGENFNGDETVMEIEFTESTSGTFYVENLTVGSTTYDLDNTYEMRILEDQGAIDAISDASSDQDTAASEFSDVAADYQAAALELGNVSENAAGLLENAGTQISNVSALTGAGSSVVDAADDLVSASDDLSTNSLYTDFFGSAATNLSDAATILNKALGGDELSDSAADLTDASDNMAKATLDLKTAGEKLKDAASNIESASATIDDSVTAIAPTGWTVSINPDGDGDTFAENDVVFSGIGDNVIAPGDSETFTFLWKSPALTTEEDYELEVWGDFYGGSWHQVETATLSVDGEAPSVDVTVMQDNVSENNLVGDNYQDGVATVKIEASEEVSLGDVTVENKTDNLLPPLSLTTADNITFTGTFDVGEWDAYNTVIKVASATDTAGNENTDISSGFTVDTKAPVLVDNGLPGLKGAMAKTDVTSAAGTTYPYVDNAATQSILVDAEDNFSSVTVGGTTYENDAGAVLDVSFAWNGNESKLSQNLVNNFEGTFTLDTGLNENIQVVATDWTGNSKSASMDNVFIDNEAPEISFDSVGGQTWDDNVEPTNDTTPKISLTLSDEGLGVAYPENLTVYLDNNHNIADGTPTFGGTLENMENYSWNADTGQETFENVVENAGSGLAPGVYWINVVASDNLCHDGSENVVKSMSFEVYTGSVTAPENVKPSGYTGDTTPTFEWSVDNDRPLVSYELVVDDSSDYSSPVIEETIDNVEVTSFTPENALEEGKYYVKVTAEYDSGQSASTEETFNIGAAEIELEKGWNMISMPLLPDNTAIRSVLSGLQDDVSIDNVVKVWSYDSATDSWKTFKPGAPAKANDLKTMKAMKGYWVKMETAATLRVPGTQLPKAGAAMPTETLHKGWNLVGFKSSQPMKRSEYLGDTIEDVTAACYEYNTASDSFEAIGPDEELQPGQAYWIAVTEQVTLYP